MVHRLAHSSLEKKRDLVYLPMQKKKKIFLWFWNYVQVPVSLIHTLRQNPENHLFTHQQAYSLGVCVKVSRSKTPSNDFPLVCMPSYFSRVQVFATLRT